MSLPNHNPRLKNWARIIPSTEPGQGRIEAPGGFENLVWQNREREPDPFEVALVSALEDIFAEGATDVEQVIAGLNKAGHHDRQGNAWSEATFLQELAVLGH